MLNFQDFQRAEDEKFVEIGADLEHARWSRWMKYMIGRMEQRKDGILQFNEEDFSRWAQQMITEYKDLSEKEKESDRKETRNYLELLSARDERLLAWVREMVEKKKQKDELGNDDWFGAGEEEKRFQRWIDGYNDAINSILHALSPQPIEPKE